MSIAAAMPASTEAHPPQPLDSSPAEPGTDPVGWTHQRLLAAMARITDCQRREAEVRAHRALRAAASWDDDRRLAVEQMARSLRRSPSLTVARLARTLHGGDWLLARWQHLRHLADTPTGWAPEHVALAHQLLGHDRTLISPDIPPWRDDGTPAALAERMIAELNGRRELLESLDAEDRAMAEEGVETEPDKVLSALRREEAAAWKVVLWAQAALERSGARAERPPTRHRETPNPRAAAPPRPPAVADPPRRPAPVLVAAAPAHSAAPSSRPTAPGRVSVELPVDRLLRRDSA